MTMGAETDVAARFWRQLAKALVAQQDVDRQPTVRATATANGSITSTGDKQTTDYTDPTGSNHRRSIMAGRT